MEQFGSLSSVDMQYIPILFRGDVSYRLSKQLLFRAGPDVVIYHYDGDVVSIRPLDPGEMEGGHSNRPMLRYSDSGFFSAPAVFSELEWTPTSRAKVVLGGRLDYFSLTKKADVSPKLNARYDIHQGFPRTTIKAGFGLFYEPPQIIQAIDVFGTPGIKSNRSVHSSMGIEQQLSEDIDVSVEVFHKYLDNLVVRQMNDDGSQGYNNVGTGYVYGSETMVRWKPGKRFFGWIAYTASRSVRKDGPTEAQRLFEYDQSHNITVLGSYDIGRGWRVGGRFRYVTGNPYTPCNGGTLNAAAGTYECIQGAQNSKRIPSFNQLDARVDKTWKFQAWSLTAYLDVQNVYNRQNAEGISYNYNYTKPSYQTGLPIIPSLGLRGEF
jgi:outer membrane receptor for ferrienterochelin and colicin